MSGALPSARATHEQSPQAVSAMPVGIANARWLPAHQERMEQRLDIIYRELRIAAIEGRMAPSNPELATASGYLKRETVSTAIRLLKDQGDLQTRIADGVRVVSFPDGARTASFPEFAKLRDEIAAAFDIEVFKLVASGRRGATVRARHAVIQTLRIKHPAIGYNTIGRVLGGRDHSTMIHAVARAAYRYERDADFRDRTDTVIAGIPAATISLDERKRRRGTFPGRYEPSASWCEQCQSRVQAERVARCASRWCSLKAVA